MTVTLKIAIMGKKPGSKEKEYMINEKLWNPLPLSLDNLTKLLVSLLFRNHQPY